MAQFYFLSVLLNILAGLILIYGKNLADESFEDENQITKTGISFGVLDFDSTTFRLIVGILSIFVAIMKIISVFRNDVPIIGDILPVFAGFAAGASILIEYYISTTSEDESITGNIYKVFIGSRKYIGIGCIVIGILHFIFPQVLFL